MSTVNVINAVTAIPAADSAVAHAHFHASLQFETDCSDVASALASGTPGFVLLDVRSPALFAQGHVPGYTFCHVLRRAALQRRSTGCCAARSVRASGEDDDRGCRGLA
jgi:hypothetical protein